MIYKSVYETGIPTDPKKCCKAPISDWLECWTRELLIGAGGTSEHFVGGPPIIHLIKHVKFCWGKYYHFSTSLRYDCHGLTLMPLPWKLLEVLGPDPTPFSSPDATIPIGVCVPHSVVASESGRRPQGKGECLFTYLEAALQLYGH